ncbi:RNA polymerase ECF-type sigma factor [Pedobacter sp. BAL39]|uniref:RNA polymerase sigma factor n=1 Tax=Pedobacter sp. BAL39 TaxID=391596 RepID=UPI000155967B|nr:sigma-70 family RNA polymerase sigma factor [Pedobacter sp. BAL39]EDM35425.1 RNA polymerase ECF-type sigma factor [Pedobacter sp. BAL39]
MEKTYWNSFVNGDQKAFEMLYNIHFDALVGYAGKFSSDVPFIEEAVQDLFVKLWQNRANLKRPESLKYYLFKALRNTIYNKLKSSALEVYVGDEADMIAFDLSADLADAEGPHEDWNVLSHKFMGNLTDRQKEAVYLFYVEEMSYKEIADLLQIKVGGTYKLIYRAMAGIREQARDFESQAGNVHLVPKG